MTDNRLEEITNLLQQQLKTTRALQIAGKKLISALQENKVAEIFAITGQQEILASRLTCLESERMALQQDLEAAFNLPDSLRDILAPIYEKLCFALDELKKDNEISKYMLNQVLAFSCQFMKATAITGEETYDHGGFVQTRQKSTRVLDLKT